MLIVRTVSLACVLAATAGIRAVPAYAASNDALHAERTVAPLLAMRAVDAHTVAPVAFSPMLHGPRFMLQFTGADPTMWRARKAAARDNRFAPFNFRPLPGARTTFTPGFSDKIGGMADSASICPYFGGCEPPDVAVAASSRWIVEGVNTSFALYGHSGNLQSGWPKTAQALLGIPNPGSCDSNGPFLTNPRAMYDPVDQRFWISIVQVEGAFGINACPEQSVLWVGVSQTNNPGGTWNVYAFDLRFGTSNAADFPEIGLDGLALYFGANMFGAKTGAFQYDEIFAAGKAAMEAGQPVTPLGLKKISAGGTLLDTIAPVLVEGVSPAAGLLVASFNINSGGGNCLSGCKGIEVFAMANQLVAPSLSHVKVASLNYSLPPLADEPGCPACIDTSDTRISATPVYSGGLISFALNTAVTNASTTTAGIEWGQIQPTLAGQTITAAAMRQNAILSFSPDQSAVYGALMPDAANNLIMVFDTMSSTIKPSVDYVARLSTDPPSTFEAPLVLKTGVTPTFNTSWGEYGATSYEGPLTNKIWMAAEYGADNGDWATVMALTHF